jgi:MYXO-CTERM domain-containing protein
VRVPITAEAIELDARPSDAGRRDASVIANDAGRDAGSPAAGLAGGACGCTVPGGSHRSAPLGLLIAIALALGARRRAPRA